MAAVLEGLGIASHQQNRPISTDFSRIGLGISDDFRLAARLSQLFLYTNSHYHKFPMLDICAPPPEALGAFDFVVCSDVLEHVPSPVERALVGLRSLLRNGGFVVVSVPSIAVLAQYGLWNREFPTRDETIEYYPDLVESHIEDGCLRWRDSSGRWWTDSSPEVHGGDGATVAYRVWSIADLSDRICQAGFTSVEAPRFLPRLKNGTADLEYSGILIARA